MVLAQPHYDPVNNPEHYASGGIECIDAMEAAYGTEVAMHFCQGNMFKYMWRFPKKNGEQDLQKANWYREKYLELKKRLDKENSGTASWSKSITVSNDGETIVAGSVPRIDNWNGITVSVPRPMEDSMNPSSKRETCYG